MPLLAKPVYKNKYWIVEEDGLKVASILPNPYGVTLIRKSQRERFPNLKALSERYNIVVDKTKTPKHAVKTNDVYGYPCSHNAQNILWDVKHQLPIFTKTSKSKSFFCAGHYIIKFNNGWVKSYCPKLITLTRYPYQGPFKTQEEVQEQLRKANGSTSRSTP